jgi:hypothetical protein
MEKLAKLAKLAERWTQASEPLVVMSLTSARELFASFANARPGSFR